MTRSSKHGRRLREQRERQAADQVGPERIAPGGLSSVVAIDSLREDPRNARVHPASNLAAITASLERFGQQKPIVHHGGTIIAGSGTLRAARALAWKRVWAVESDLLSEADRMAYAIADNRTAELSEWDFSRLGDQLVEVSAPGEDLSALFGKDWPVVAWKPATPGALPDPSSNHHAGDHHLHFAAEHWRAVGAAIERARALWGSGLTDAECLVKVARWFLDSEARP